MYGELDHVTERELHNADHRAWCEYVAPWWRVQLLLFGEPAIREWWPRISTSLKASIWRISPRDLRALITRIREESTDGTQRSK